MEDMRGLVIDEPWISKILAGEKVWEMRSQKTQTRGAVALIKKGTGTIVGVANLCDVSGQHDVDSLAATEKYHGIGPDIYRRPDYKWWFAWQLADIKRLNNPVPYEHKNGAVIWVRLESQVIRAVADQIGAGLAQSDDVVALDATQNELRSNRDVQESTTSISVSAEDAPGVHVDDNRQGKSISITLTSGNINNNHFYIPRQTKLFSENVWGGKNKAELGKEVEFRFMGMAHSVRSDIDGAKRILRKRGIVGEFYRLHEARAGDELRIANAGDGVYSVSIINRDVALN